MYSNMLRIKQLGGGCQIFLNHVFFAFYAISNIFREQFVGVFFVQNKNLISCFVMMNNLMLGVDMRARIEMAGVVSF